MMTIRPNPTAFSAPVQFAGGGKRWRGIKTAGAVLAAVLTLGGVNTVQNLSSGSCRDFYSPIQMSQGPDTFVPLAKSLPMDTQHVLAVLQQHQALHAANSSGRWDYFKKNGNFTIADFDLQIDERGRLILAHDEPDYFLGTDFGYNSLSFVDTMAERFKDMEKLPPGKLAAVKLDVKDAAAYEQLIPLLKEHAGLFGRALLIINEGFNRDNPENDPRVAAVKKIKAMIPNTVVSIGADKYEDLRDPAFKPGIERVMNALGDGVYTLAVSNEQQVPADLFDWLDDHNAFLTLWAYKAALTCDPHEKDWVADEFRAKIPPQYHHSFWQEF